MIQHVSFVSMTEMTCVDWTQLSAGTAFEGIYEGFEGIFLRIPSGLVLLSGDRSGNLRNWIRNGGPEVTANVFRYVNIDFTTSPT